MEYNYTVTCKKCKNDIQGTYNTKIDNVHLPKCPYCMANISSSEAERLRHVLDSICSISEKLDFSVASVQRKS